MQLLLTFIVPILLTKTLHGMKPFYSINLAVLDDHNCNEGDIETSKSGVESELQCLYYCTLNRQCRSLFYHPQDMMCTICKKEFIDASLHRSTPGTKYYRPLASSCKEGKQILNSQGNTYKAEVDPDGFESEFSKFTVICNEELGQLRTIIHHDKEKRRHVSGYEDPGSYKLDLTYKIGLESIRHVIDTSSACKQHIKYECRSSLILSPTDVDVFWINRFNMTSLYFTGNGSSLYFCECTESCTIPFGCQCNNNDDIWRSDEGYVTNKEDLPILAFRAGDTGDLGEESYHTIGPLICW